MKKVRFKQEHTKEDSVWTDWINPVMNNYHMACCDCSLVHTLNFRAFKVLKRHKNGSKDCITLPKDEYQIEFKIRRNKKLTNQLRKNDKN